MAVTSDWRILRLMRSSIRLSLLAAALSHSLYAGSFESAPEGRFTELITSVGTWSAAEGHASVQGGHAKTGNRSLRVSGEGERIATLKLAAPAEKGSLLSFHAERWTARAPFRFVIDARGEGDWSEVRDAGDVAVGGFKTEVRIPLPEGTRELRFRCEAPAEAGVLLDDFSLLRPGPARAVLVDTVQPVCPAFIREDFNPVLGFRVVVDGSEGKVRFEGIEASLDGTTHPRDVERLRVFAGSADPSAAPGEVIAETSRLGGKFTLTVKRELEAGEHWFWLSPELRDNASMDGRIDASVFRVKVGGKTLEPATPSPEGSQRIGYAVRVPGDDGSKSYRIPGMARTKAGSLLAVYDVRYHHAGDLPADIDVGVSRSTDGGRSWEPMRVAMDMGRDPKHHYDGVGDPAILVDPRSGRVWVAALWSHGNRAWNGSGPGMTPEETGQFMLAYSDDDGKTWSKPINITEQVKDPAWRLCFNGPGAGIVLKDGTLVFAAQFRDEGGKPWSTLVASVDEGRTWTIGSGVKSDTTEAQVAQLADGSIMINCRDNRGGSRTVAATRDLGKTWELHPTDRQALRESVCMASLLAWEHPERGHLLWFSNPDTTRGRHSMTVKLSTDQGMTWPEENHLLYDSRHGYGYSCLAPVDAEHIGVLYEGRDTMYFLRFPLGEWTR